MFACYILAIPISHAFVDHPVHFYSALRLFALSDIHVDFEANRKWLEGLSRFDYKNDTLLLAGDVSDIESLLAWAFEVLSDCFAEVCFVPGNHDLWVMRSEQSNSFDKLERVLAIAEERRVHTGPVLFGTIGVIPLWGWYDFSFGEPGDSLKKAWNDFSACRWPEGCTERSLTEHFLSRNVIDPPEGAQQLITFSHFMPRIDLMPASMPAKRKMIFPVLGSSRLDEQIRSLGSTLHLYGHSHLNRHLTIDNVTYINNAFGYPHETLITRKELISIDLSSSGVS